jgi:flagellar export protein FliJ
MTGMSAVNLQKSLTTLIDLRKTELEKRQAELARQQALCARVQVNIDRLDQLAQGVGEQRGFVSADLALNAAAYKQSVLRLAESQRQELQRQLALASSAQQAVRAVAVKQEVLGQVLNASLTRSALEAARKSQKVQDDLAAQVWMRGQA